MNNSLLKSVVRSSYNLQKMRIQIGNRICAHFRVKLGQEPGEAEEELNKDALELIHSLHREYQRITDGIVRLNHKTVKFETEGLITDLTEVYLIRSYIRQLEVEEEQFDSLKKILTEYPIWNHYLKSVNGIGEKMGAVIISSFEIQKARYVSSLWRYAGLGVMFDGKGDSKRDEHLIDREYTYKDRETGKMVTKTRKSVVYNPWVKSKVLYGLGTSFLRQGPEKSIYAKMYYEYRNRLENHINWTEATKLHKHRAAIRYMVKRFLADLYVQWRTIEGLEVMPSYEERMLGRAPHHGG